MSVCTLILGKSGSGKSASMMHLDPAKTALISVLGKPLPFKGKFEQFVTDDSAKIIGAVKATKREIVVIDDANYVMTNIFMRDHSATGGGNSVFTLYNTIGDKFWNMIDAFSKIPEDKRIYVMMHEEQNDFGNIRPKTIGKMIDEKVCLEGMFTICLRCIVANGKHIFRTQSDGLDVSKSPMGMFETDEIPNDLAYVDKTICEYYEIGGKAK